MFSTIIPISLGENVRISNEKEIQSTTSCDSGLLDSAWPMYCHDTRHTGRSQYSTASNSGDEKWWFKTTHDTYFYNDVSYVIIGYDGTIYFADVDGYVYAFYSNLTLKWRYDEFGQCTIECHPAIDKDGCLYVGTSYGLFYSIYPNGTLKWKYVFPQSMIFSSPAISDDGTIYFGTQDPGYLNAFYPNGTMKWRYKLVSEGMHSSPAIADDGTIYCGDHSGYFYAIYPNGNLYWRIELPNFIPNSPSIADDGTIYVTTWNDEDEGDLYAIYPNNGTIKWKYKIGSDWYQNPSLAEDGTIYVLGSGKLYAVNPDGSEKWTRTLGGSDLYIPYSSPAIGADGIIYVSAANFLLAVNPDGTDRWGKTFEIPFFKVESSPVIGEDGTVYLGLTHFINPEPSHCDRVTYFHAFNEIDSNAPSAPEITGPTRGIPDECYNYTIVSTDPDGDEICYYICWGEKYGQNIPYALEEFGPFPSGEEITVNYSWRHYGQFTIKVIAKDSNNFLSPWVTLKVEMPRNRATYNPYWLKFIDMFPILQRLLNHIL